MNRNAHRRKTVIKKPSNRCMTNRRNVLFKRNPHCYYCGCVTKKISDDQMLDNTATVEHLYTRMDLRRLLVTSDENTVLACYKCNNNKASVENRQFTEEYRRLAPIVIMDIREYAHSLWMSKLIRIKLKIIKFLLYGTNRRCNKKMDESKLCH